MKSKLRSAFLLALLASVLTALPAFAGPPLALHMEVDEILGTSGERFEATGPAVGEGPLLVCKTGTVDDPSVAVVGGGSSSYTFLRVQKRFTCEDMTGTFDIQLLVRLNNTTRETVARWHITGGTGKYSSLRGRGGLVGTPIVPGSSIHDVYDGWAQ
jgi:hypothetical protein